MDLSKRAVKFPIKKFEKPIKAEKNIFRTKNNQKTESDENIYIRPGSGQTYRQKGNS